MLARIVDDEAHAGVELRLRRHIDGHEIVCLWRRAVGAMQGWICCFALALAGCAGAGTLVTPRDVAYFVPHQTTSSEILAWLGEPTHFETERDGSAQMVYDWSRTTLEPQDILPVVGVLFGAADTSRIETIIYIGRDGTYDGVGRRIDQIPSGQFLAAP